MSSFLWNILLLSCIIINYRIVLIKSASILVILNEDLINAWNELHFSNTAVTFLCQSNLHDLEVVYGLSPRLLTQLNIVHSHEISPKYIIFDYNGKLINRNAPRPGYILKNKSVLLNLLK